MDEKKRTRPAFRTRSVTRDGMRFSRLKQLSCYEEIHQKILAGWTLSELARWVQEERDEYTEIPRNSLIQILSDYRASLPPGEMVGKVMPSTQVRQVVQATKRLESGLNELEELQKLYQLQMERIAIDHTLERQLKKLLNTMTPEIKVAREILETSAQLKIELGLTPRNMGGVDVQADVMANMAERYGNEAVAKVVEDPKSRRKLLDLVERFVTISQGSDSFSSIPSSDSVIEGPIEEKPAAD